ncbi:cell division protein ZapA [Chitinivorax sp. PXF-14]|uniref:cell division protein ZapA n=1 Tax=Chitinivorax sp. PXF-14 TaxID=3230488 RepID=UPI003466CC82
MKNLDVTIMGREFRIACPEEDEPVLMQAVDMLDGKMQEIKDAGKIIGVDKIAIMAALNLTHELLSTRVSGGDVDLGEFKRKVAHMNEMIDTAMLEQNRLF